MEKCSIKLKVTVCKLIMLLMGSEWQTLIFISAKVHSSCRGLKPWVAYWYAHYDPDSDFRFWIWNAVRGKNTIWSFYLLEVTRFALLPCTCINCRYDLIIFKRTKAGRAGGCSLILNFKSTDIRAAVPGTVTSHSDMQPGDLYEILSTIFFTDKITFSPNKNVLKSLLAP